MIFLKYLFTLILFAIIAFYLYENIDRWFNHGYSSSEIETIKQNLKPYNGEVFSEDCTEIMVGPRKGEINCKQYIIDVD